MATIMDKLKSFLNIGVKVKAGTLEKELIVMDPAKVTSNKPKLRRATNRELAKWLREGNGDVGYGMDGIPVAFIGFRYYANEEDFPVREDVYIRKWEDTEWHEPTADYLGLEDRV